MRVVTLVAVAATVLGLAAAPVAAEPAGPTAVTAKHAPKSGPAQRECAAPAPRHVACLAYRRTDVAHPAGVQRAQTAPEGYAPADLTSAYRLPNGGGAGQTVAITIAYDNPHLESDLAVYRQQYGLPACTTANGCFRKLDQRGGTDYPIPDEHWGGESDLDVDMVSAACPLCHIVVVEADDSTETSLFAAVDQAVAQGARFVSNSWGGTEDPTAAQQYDKHFQHPGVAFTVSSGDNGFELEYPAFSQYVTAVGGTSLRPATNDRGWTESAWSGAGAGCADQEPKPSWQHDALCAHRMEADVSAVADPNTGVAVYDDGWQVFGGTSVAAPLIAGVYALAGTPATDEPANSYPYARPDQLNDVTSGADGYCPGSEYFCTAGPGYDGPTGLGTPDGVGAFTFGPHGQVTGTVRDAQTGQPVDDVAVTAGEASATTDARGHYALSVPLGTVSVSAARFGYRTATSSVDITGDGQQVTLDLPLTPLPHVTISGRLTDGSGHGWPLYGTVQLDGHPTTVVRADAASGRYQLSVPADGNYTLVATPAYRGYQPLRQDVTVGDTDQTVDLAAPVDATACDAPGYAVRIDPALTEYFDGATLPAGWTVSSGGLDWRVAGGAAHVAGSGVDQYERAALTSPVIDLTGVSHPVMTMSTAYQPGSTAQIFAISGGSSHEVWLASSDAHGSATLDLSAVAGRPDVTVEFFYQDFGSGSWDVDDLIVGNRSCAAQPGGLVTGQVTDRNTGTPVRTATVAGAAVLSDGARYAAFEPAGARTVTASAPDGYRPDSHDVEVTADALSTVDFALPAGQLSAGPTSVNAGTALGGRTTATFTVTNTGSAPAALTLHPAPVDAPAAAGAPRIAGPKASPTRSRQAFRAAARTGGIASHSPPWTASADYPLDVADAAAATAPDGTVYSLGGTSSQAADGLLAEAWRLDPRAGTWTRLPDMPQERYEARAAFLLGRLYVIGGLDVDGNPIADVAVYDPATATWSTGPSIPHPVSSPGLATLGGQLYVVGGCDNSAQCGRTTVQVYDPVARTWSAAPDYPAATAWSGCGGIGGKVYCAGGATTTATQAGGYAFDPEHAAWSPIADLPGGLWGASVAAQGGRLLLSGGVLDGSITNAGFSYDPTADTWSSLPNANEASYAAAGACGLYRIGGWVDQTDISSSVQVLPGSGSCSPTGAPTWLSASPATATVAPGASVHVTVTLDATSVPAPGTYLAGLTGAEDTPYAAVWEPVTFTVTPPSTWAELSGTVTGRPCSGASGPLAGATVSVVGASTTTVATDTFGHYDVWLDARVRSITVYVSLDGWAPQAKTTKITKGGHTTLNVDLRPDHTCR
jgi:N-acetylneuraminic acid mutarotase